MLEDVDRIMSRMQQLETRFDRGPQVDSDAFKNAMGKAHKKGGPEQAKGKLTADQMYALRSPGMGIDPSQFGASKSGTLNVQPLPQSNSISCGQTSVAVTVNALTGKNLKDTDIDGKYGFELLRALNEETNAAGYKWKDGGEIGQDKWELIEHKVNQEKIPVIVALNGPEFSPSGHGHIMTISKVEGDTVTLADSATGQLRTTTKSAMNNAPQHPDGNFVFYGTREDPMSNFAANVR